MTPRALTYTFPLPDVAAVCQLQTLGAAGALTLNGSLVNPVTGVMSFIDHGYIRNISITSTHNLTGVDFTVTGIQNGALVDEVIQGPNNGTRAGVKIYDTITSITTDGAAADVSVGSGRNGSFPLIQINPYVQSINYTLSVTSHDAENPPPIGVYGTIENIINNGDSYAENLAKLIFFPIIEVGNNIPYIYGNVPYVNAPNNEALNPTYYQIWVILGGANVDFDEPVTLRFVQN